MALSFNVIIYNRIHFASTECNGIRKITEKTDTDEQQKEEGESNLTSLKASSVCLWEAVRWQQKDVLTPGCQERTVLQRFPRWRPGISLHCITIFPTTCTIPQILARKKFGSKAIAYLLQEKRNSTLRGNSTFFQCCPLILSTIYSQTNHGLI